MLVRSERLPVAALFSLLTLLGPCATAKADSNRLILGIGGGIGHRPANAARVDYAPGPVWTALAKIVFFRELRLRLSTELEQHSVTLKPGALGLGEAASESDLSGLRMGAHLEPVWPLSAELAAWCSVGVGWARFVSDPLRLRVQGGGEVLLQQKSGVMVEYPATLGVTWLLFEQQLGLSLSASYALSTAQSGALFEDAGGQRQALRQDTGTLVTVGGFPEFDNALHTQLTLDLFL